MFHSVWFIRLLYFFVGVGSGIIGLWIIGTWQERAEKRQNIGNRMWQDSAAHRDTMRKPKPQSGDSHTHVGRN